MKLYLDLNKAGGQVPSTAMDSTPERTNVRAYNESFSRVSPGVMGGDPTGDSGGHHGDTSLDDELEADRKKDSDIAQERGLIQGMKPKGEEEDTKKSFAAELLDSFTVGLQKSLHATLPNDREVEFLLERGYSRDDILKGYAKITGADRARFVAWLEDRFHKSLDRLYR